MNTNDMTLSLKSDTFSALKEDFDSILARTIGNMEMKGAEEATVTLKLGISLEKSNISSPNGMKEIIKPSFKHDISSVMQVKDKKSGALTGDYELVWDPDERKYVMVRIDDGQTSIFNDDDIIDSDYEEAVDEPVALPEARLESDAEGDDEGYYDVSTPFGWLKQFVGKAMQVTEALGNFTVRTEDNKIVLSSATREGSPFYCPSERLEAHVGHTLSCVMEKDSDGRETIFIDCDDCDENVFYISSSDADEHEDYDYDEPEDEG